MDNSKTKYQNYEKALFIYHNLNKFSLEESIKMCNIYHNIKYYNCVYTEEQTNLSFQNCPELILKNNVTNM